MSQIAAPQSRQLKMQYAGGLVKHLGLSMYRGAVPSIAELIANAWDADASEVEVSIPFDTGLKDETIVVRDQGRGMSWDDVDRAYLVVGRDKRKAEGEKSPGGRLLMGRKGLGKLAGFGIAQVVEVRTIHDHWLTHFSMHFADMTKGGEAEMVEPYQPRIIADERTEDPNGTTITLRDLQLTRSISRDSFHESMARRFSILEKGFKVIVNGQPLRAYEVQCQFKFEGEHEGWEDVSGVGQVKWWVGFAEKPIQAEPARGIAIIVRHRMAQNPFFFDLSGGAYGQAGMQYMTGEVYVDQLDDNADYIGTDRQGILWAEPMPAALLQWGENKVRRLLRAWSDRRSQANEEKLIREVVKDDETVEARLARLQPTEQKEARRLIRELAGIKSVTDDPERARDILDMVLRAFEDSSFFALIRALKETDQAERDEILKLVTELDVFETVKMAEVVRARVGVIEKFKTMIESNVREKPDLQEFLFNHSWLIDPTWLVVEREKGLERILVDHFKLDPAEQDSDSERRVDFFCIGARGRCLVVEVKRPHKVLGKMEVQQIMDYVLYLRQQAPQNQYEGVLVGHHLSQEGLRWRDQAAQGHIIVRSWQELLDVAERIHQEFLEIMKSKVPNDVRIRQLGAK